MQVVNSARGAATMPLCRRTLGGGRASGHARRADPFYGGAHAASCVARRDTRTAPCPPVAAPQMFM
eukprot:1988329-Prymnesium_polylepis.2